MRTIKAGSKALLVYPAGDADTVTVLSLTEAGAVVRTGSGKVLMTVPEDIGIGTDDELRAVYDSGLCDHVVHRGDRQSLQCQRVAHGREVNHLHTVALGWDRSSGRSLPITKPILNAPVQGPIVPMVNTLLRQADEAMRAGYPETADALFAAAGRADLRASVVADSPSLTGDDLDSVVRAREAIIAPARHTSQIVLTIEVEHEGSMVPARMLTAMARYGVANGLGTTVKVTATMQSGFIVNQRALTASEQGSLDTDVNRGLVRRAGGWS
jgi:hypothetical protein